MRRRVAILVLLGFPVVVMLIVGVLSLLMSGAGLDLRDEVFAEPRAAILEHDALSTYTKEQLGPLLKSQCELEESISVFLTHNRAAWRAFGICLVTLSVVQSIIAWMVLRKALHTKPNPSLQRPASGGDDSGEGR